MVEGPPASSSSPLRTSVCYPSIRMLTDMMRLPYLAPICAAVIYLTRHKHRCSVSQVIYLYVINTILIHETLIFTHSILIPMLSIVPITELNIQFHLLIPMFSLYTCVIRLSLGRRMVSLLPVAQRTNAFPNGVVDRPWVVGREFESHVHHENAF